MKNARVSRLRLPCPKGALALVGVLLLSGVASAQERSTEPRILARGAESYGPVTPIRTVPLRSLAQVEAWKPGDPIKEIPRRTFEAPGQEPQAHGEGLLDPLILRQVERSQSSSRAPTTTPLLDFDGQGFSGATPPDTVGDVGPDHYVQAVNASLVAVYDKSGSMLPGYPIALESLAPSGPCTSGSGDPIVLYDWLADRWFLQEFTGGGTLCIYVSTSADPTGTYNFYSYDPPAFPDYPHYGVWPDAYYGATNEGSETAEKTYAFDRVAMLAGDPATMQRLAVVPPLSAYNFQTLTPADHDGDTPPPPGSPGIFMRHNDDEAHSGSPDPATDILEIWEMDVDWDNPGNTTVTALPTIDITDFNSWMINYTTFFSVSQPGSGTLLDAIREAILQRLVYRNFGTHEALVGVFATNRDPATSGSSVQQGNRWFELRRAISGRGPGGWTLHDEGTFGGDTDSPTANFFMGSVAMNGQGDLALGYSKTDVGGTPVFPSLGFAGRLAGDPAGTLDGEHDLVLGGGPSSSGRWGDYAAMSIDPADDCTFWFTSEYIPVSGTWGTRIGSFVFEDCLFGFVLDTDPDQVDVCVPTDPDPMIDIDVSEVGGWTGMVTLAASGEPAGATVGFTNNPGTVDFSSVMTISNLGGATTGTYPITVEGTGNDAPPTVRTKQVVLDLAAADPGTPGLTSPADTATDVALKPTFEWSAASDATTYTLEVATDAGFGDVIYEAENLTGTSHELAGSLDPSTTYHWRLTADNICGATESASASFRTVLLTCREHSSADVPLPIPPGAPGTTSGTTTSDLVIGVNDGGAIADVDVLDLVGTHTYMGDLDFTLESPEGTMVEFRGRACGSAEDFDIAYDDEAVPGSPPCPPTDGGTYQPDAPLAGFDGEEASGTWTLTIVDNAGSDSGQLDSWGLRLCVEITEEIFADGFESGDTSLWPGP